MIRGAHHVAISTPDMDGLLWFYRDLMGFRQVQDFTWEPGVDMVDKILDLTGSSARQAMLKGDNLCIELFEYHSPTPSAMTPNRPVCDHGHTHLCFDVVNIEEEYQRLVDAGIRFHAPPQDFGHLKSTYGRDPDGNVFEIQELLDPDDPCRVFDS
jgi:catechol 2,3-dioxygenase-like lactoylglutathione lyase family enzyme